MECLIAITLVYAILYIPMKFIVNPIREIIEYNQLRQKGLLIVQEHPEFLFEAIQGFREIVYESIDSSQTILRKIARNQAINHVLPRIHGGLTKTEFYAILKDLSRCENLDNWTLSSMVASYNQYTEREKERIAKEELKQKYGDLFGNSVLTKQDEQLIDGLRRFQRDYERRVKEEPNK